MTRIVLDTNALIWLVRGGVQLGDKSRVMAGNAALDGTLYVSAMSFWEIGMLVAKGRFVLDRSVVQWRRDALDQGILEIPLTGNVGIVSTVLEGLPNDPADRIIVATALSIGGTLITADGRLLRWDGPLVRQDARE